MNEKLQQNTARLSRGFFGAVLVATLSVLASCSSSSKSVQLGQSSVGRFHTQLDAEQYSSIYAASDEGFHAATSENDFVKLLQAIHNKLGSVRKSNRVNTGVAWFAGRGTTVTLVYDTDFSHGTATEQFVWHIKDDHASLYSYRINSNDLIKK